MTTRPSTRNSASSLSIHPPSPTAHLHSSSTTPTHPTFSNFPSPLPSPRRAALNPPASPTYSTHSNFTNPSIPWLENRSRAGSLDVPRERAWEPPPVPPKNEKRLPTVPGYAGNGYGAPPSPHRVQSNGGKGSYAGAYDAKLVTSSLSQLPPLPPLSPTPTGNSSFSHSQQHHTNPYQSTNHLHPSSNSIPHTLSSSSSYATLPYSTHSRPSLPAPASSSSVVVLPDGTALPTAPIERERAHEAGSGRSVQETLAHSSPSSPWSLLTVHVLPLFAGGALKTPIEDLNQLCHSHIINTSQRAAASRLVAVLTSDLREFVASGMLTLKAKFETLEETKIVNRAAEVWSFFWAQVLPYLEGVFLPFSQIRDLPSTTHASTSTNAPTQPVPVRHILLSGFLLHILLPLLPRLLPLITHSNDLSTSSPTTPDLQRILQMSLVLSTQARYSTFIPSNENERRDEEVRVNVESLGKAVRWRMEAATRLAEERASASSGTAEPESKPMPQRMSLQRGPSMNGAKYRRRGWRASANFGSTWGQPPSDPLNPPNPTQRRQNSNTDYLQAPEQRWGKPRLDENDDDEDDDTSTPGQSFAQTGGGGHPARLNATGGVGLGGTFVSSGVGTVRGESLASYGDSQRTPLAEQRDGYGVRRPMRDEESEVTPVVRDRDRDKDRRG